jgi:hypothetical protein
MNCKVSYPFSYGRSKTVIASEAKQSRNFEDCQWDGHLARHSESTGDTPVPPITPRNDNPAPRVTEGLQVIGVIV